MVPWALHFCTISGEMEPEWRLSKVLSDKGETATRKAPRSVSVVYGGQARISEAGPEGTEERRREELCLLAPWWL